MFYFTSATKDSKEKRWAFIDQLIPAAAIVIFQRAAVNIPIKTLIISPGLSFRKMIISLLELGPPVVDSLCRYCYFQLVDGELLNDTNATTQDQL